MNFKKLLPMMAVLTLGVAALVGCGGGGGEEGGLPDDGKQHTLVIKNEDDIKAEWHVGDATRSLELEITDDGAAGNIAASIVAGNLKVSSSNSDVLGAAGIVLTAKAEGTATLTVSYFKVVKTLELTIQKLLTPQEKYGTVHTGTEEDPFDNSDACKVGLWAKDNGNTEEFYIKGVVESFYHAPGSRTDGAVSWFLKKAEGDTASFEIYKAYASDGKTPLTDDDIWKGAEVLASGIITYYAASNQPETTEGSKFIRVTGGADKPQPKQELTKTFAEVLAVGTALADGDSAWDLYTFDAYVTKQEGTNFFLTATKTEALSQKTYGETTYKYYENGIELYNPAEAVAAKLLKNAKVTISNFTIKNYHGQVENGTNDYVVTVVEEGEAWSINYTKVNVAQALTAAKALEDGATSEEHYEMTALVKEVTSAWSSKYGNMDFTVVDAAEDTETIKVFRLKVTEEQAALIVAGAKVVVKGQLQNYVKDEVHTYELVNGALAQVDANVAGALAVAKKLEDGKTSDESYNVKGLVKEVTSAWSSKYGNMDFTIVDAAEDTETIKVFRLKVTEAEAATIVAGVQVTILGQLQNYVKDEVHTYELVSGKLVSVAA